MIELSLANSEKKAFVDNDFFYLSNSKWYLDKKGNNPLHYAKASIDGKRVFLHRLVLNAKKGQMIDHKNNNGLDCRKDNLRLCTNRQNIANSRPQKNKTSSKYKGVTFCTTEKRIKRWKVYCEYDKKPIYVGRFHTEKEAVESYNKKAKELWGDFAYQNKWDGETQ